MRIEEGVYRVDGVRGANCYLVDRPEGLLLVDLGMPGSTKAIVAFIRGLGREVGDVSDIVITHTDLDHIGSAAEMVRLTGATLAVSAQDAPVLTGAPSPKLSDGPLGLVFRILTWILRPERVEPDRLLAEGDTVAGFRVMHAPGHTPGSIALVRDDGLVFSGDTLLGDRDGNLLPAAGIVTLDLEQALASGERIKQLSPRLVLPGHGAPVTLR